MAELDMNGEVQLVCTTAIKGWSYPDDPWIGSNRYIDPIPLDARAVETD